MPPWHFVLAMTFALCVSGCAVGPDYTTPEIKLPAVFETWRSAESNQPGIDQIQAANIVAWWKTLRDPELNSLIERAILGNPDIEIALDRVQQAREHEIVVLGRRCRTSVPGEASPVAQGPIRSSPPAYRRRSMPVSTRPISRRFRELQASMRDGNSIYSESTGVPWRRRVMILKLRSKQETRLSLRWWRRWRETTSCCADCSCALPMFGKTSDAPSGT